MLTSTRGIAVSALVLLAACGSARDDDPAQVDASVPGGFERFESGRAEGEVTILEAMRPDVDRMLSRESYAWGDPLGLGTLLANYESTNGVLRAEELAWIDALFQNWDEVQGYLRERTRAARTLDGIAAAVAMSRLVAYLQNTQDLPEGSAARIDDDAVQAFETRFASLVAQLSADWPAIAIPDLLNGPLSYPGSDCGAAPPADGTQPPDFINTIEEIMMHGRQLIEDEEEGLDLSRGERKPALSSALQRYRNTVDWWQIRNDPVREEHDPSQHDSEALTEDMLERYTAVLEALKVGPDGGTAMAAALGDGSFGAFLQAQQTFEASVRSHLSWGANLSAHDLIDSVDTSSEAFAYFENTTYRDGSPDLSLVDGRFFPGIRQDLEATIGDLRLSYDAPNEHVAVAFKPWRISRKLSHIDFRLRRLGDDEVLAEFRNVENDDGDIAFGHTFDLDRFQPSGTASETYVVQAVPVDAANHPTEGSCAFLHVTWAAQGSSESSATAPAPMPALPVDRICDDGLLDAASPVYDIPPRNIELHSSVNPQVVSHRVLPPRLSITTSGETIRITNLDDQPHRYITTSNFEFETLGSTELDGPSTDTNAQRFLDTGVMPASSERVLQLPVDNDDPDNGDDVPSPYWFNLIEVEEQGSQLVPVEDSPPIHILYQNPDCL